MLFLSFGRIVLACNYTSVFSASFSAVTGMSGIDRSKPCIPHHHSNKMPRLFGERIRIYTGCVSIPGSLYVHLFVPAHQTAFFRMDCVILFLDDFSCKARSAECLFRRSSYSYCRRAKRSCLTVATLEIICRQEPASSASTNRSAILDHQHDIT
jgi:hypothetical protein